VNTKDLAGLGLDRPLPNTYWVIPGRFLAGEHPGGADLADTPARLLPARLMQLTNAGIDCFVDLTEDGERPEYRHLLPQRAWYLRSSIADCRVPNNVSQVQELLSRIRAALALGRNVYLHCRAGIGRTGLIVGCFLAEEQGDGKAAIKQLNRLWRQSARAETWRKVPQTPEQADYIRHWPRLTKGNSAA
jgi:hypothetical protein